MSIVTNIIKAEAKRQRLQKRGGIFITFEGGEGSGKTTQIKRLNTKLEDVGHSVVVTREPGGSAGAEAVRHVLLSSAAEQFGPEMEAILFSAARSDNVETIIKPALKQNQIVICDRFFDSTRVYQGATGGVDINLLHQLEQIACEGAWPDLTIVLDLPPQTGMQRANARRKKGETADRFEKETISKQEKRRKAYLKIAKDEPDRVVIVDADGTTAQVFKRVWAIIEERLGSQLESVLKRTKASSSSTTRSRARRKTAK